MLGRLSDEMRVCHHHLERCEREAVNARRSLSWRSEHARLADSWRRLAASYEFAGRISGFLEWQAQRLVPPPEDY